MGTKSNAAAATTKSVEQIYGSEQDLFRMTGIPPRGWQKLRWGRKGPPYFKRPGSNRVYYRLSDVRSWMETQKVEPAR